MKKTQKKALGLLGLGLVAATTTFAATLPTPGASATSVTDTITVRVVGSTPDVDFTSFSGTITTTSPILPIIFNYENVDTLTITATYDDGRGNSPSSEQGSARLLDFQSDFGADLGIIYQSSPDYETGTGINTTYDMNSHGYGRYTFVIRGVGYNGVFDEETAIVNYVPLIASATEQEDGSLDLDLGLDSQSGNIEQIRIVIKDADGNPVGDPIVLNPAAGAENLTTSIDFSGIDGIETGDYTLEIYSYDSTASDATALYLPYILSYHYEAPTVPNAGAPDTGGLFKDLNISKEDYLITGLIIFFVLGIVAFGVVARGRKARK